MSVRFYRYWQYFRLGFSKYLSHPLSLFNFLTLTYLYLVERIPFFSIHFTTFVVLAITTIIPVGVFVGWFDMRKSRIHSTEVIVSTESNPQNIHIQRVTYENTLLLFKALGIEPTHEWMKIYDYWRKLDEGRWTP